jgi:hypothetical protein
MARVVIFDQATDYVTAYLPSANTPEYEGNPEALIEPAGLDALLIGDVPRFDWIHDTADVREMTQQEKDDRDAAAAAAADAALRVDAKAEFDGQFVTPLSLRALADIIKREINILRALHSLPDRTLAQLKTAIRDAIDQGEVDE